MQICNCGRQLEVYFSCPGCRKSYCYGYLRLEGAPVENATPETPSDIQTLISLYKLSKNQGETLDVEDVMSVMGMGAGNGDNDLTKIIGELLKGKKQGGKASESSAKEQNRARDMLSKTSAGEADFIATRKISEISDEPTQDMQMPADAD